MEKNPMPTDNASSEYYAKRYSRSVPTHPMSSIFRLQNKTMKELVLGLFPSHKDAENARLQLKDVGVNNEEITLIAEEDRVSKLRTVRKHLTGEGALTGGVLGGLAGILVAATPVVISGMGILLIGPLVIFIGFAIGAVTGGILGTLVDLGISVSQMKRYKERIKAGGVLLATPVDEEKIEEIQEVMEESKAEEQTIIPYRSTEEKIEIPRVPA